MPAKKKISELKTYQNKRDFKATPEPRGRIIEKNRKKLGTNIRKSTNRQKKLLFVMHKHAASHLHYDLRLEIGGTLKSWAVPKGPSLDPSVKRLAMHVEDHPIEYGSFEGVIPKGHYGAGPVIIWDTGFWQCENEGDPTPIEAYIKGDLTIKIEGKKLKGLWKLIRMKKSNQKDNSWLFFKKNDKYAKTDLDITEKKPKSVVSKLTIEQIGGNENPIKQRKKSGIVIINKENKRNRKRNK